jgi:phage gpG-like protein
MPGMGFGKRGGGSVVGLDSSALTEVLERLQRAGASVMAEVSPALAEILVTAVQEVFEREGAVGGRPKWPDLAESTKRSRAKRQPGGKTKRGPYDAKSRPVGVFKILQDTGILAGSITPFSDGIEAEAFTNVPYAGYHISDAPRQKIPLRDFTDIDFEAAQREAIELILSQLVSTAA